MIAVAFVSPVVIAAAGGLTWFILFPLLALPLAVPLVRAVGTHTDGPSLNAALGGTGKLLAAYSILLAVGILMST